MENERRLDAEMDRMRRESLAEQRDKERQMHGQRYCLGRPHTEYNACRERVRGMSIQEIQDLAEAEELSATAMKHAAEAKEAERQEADRARWLAESQAAHAAQAAQDAEDYRTGDDLVERVCDAGERILEGARILTRDDEVKKISGTSDLVARHAAGQAIAQARAELQAAMDEWKQRFPGRPFSERESRCLNDAIESVLAQAQRSK